MSAKNRLPLNLVTDIMSSTVSREGRLNAIMKQRSSKQEREHQVLIGVVELYLKERKPIGSEHLKEHYFESISSATIRNYFAKMEEQGLLTQAHTSGGRIPTEKAFRCYAKNYFDSKALDSKDDLFLSTLLLNETKELAQYLQRSVEALAELTHSAAFISSPRFDQDFISNMKLVGLDEHRIMCICISEFSLIHTEILYTPRKFSTFTVRRIEEYFRYRLSGLNKPHLSIDELQFAKQAFNEMMLRHFVQYASFSKEDIYKAGFAKMLSHNAFEEVSTLVQSLSLFENTQILRSILQNQEESEHIHYLIGNDLDKYYPTQGKSSVITIPYKIQEKIVGSVGLLTPMSIDYRQIFAILRKFSAYLSENLTKSVEIHQVTYRRPSMQYLDMQGGPPQALLQVSHD